MINNIVSICNNTHTTERY